MAGGRVGQTLPLIFASFRRRATWFTLFPTRFNAALNPFNSSVMPSSGRRRSSAASIRQRMASDRWAIRRRARAGIEATKVAVGDPHGQNTGAAVVGRDGRPAPAEHVVDCLGRDLQRRTDRTDRDAFRPFPDDLTTLLIGQSATVPHVKYTFLFLANFVQARLLPAQAEKAPRACTQCRKSASRADLTSFGNCSAHRAPCNASRVLCTAHRVLWTAFCAPSSTSSAQRQMACVARIAHGAGCATSRAGCILFRASGTMADVECRTASAGCIARTGGRPLSHVRCFPPDVRSTVRPAAR